MDIDFSTMQIGDKHALPPGKWGNDQRAVFEGATAFQRANPGVQFEVTGHEGSDFERGQYWITRIK